MSSIKQIALNIISGAESLYDSYNTDTVNQLLTRDWFIDEDDILDVLDSADKTAYAYVYNNRSKYSKRIHQLIEPDDFRFPIKKLNVRVLNITEPMMKNIETEHKKSVSDMFERKWIEYSKDIQDRTIGEVDTDLDNAWDKFCQAKESLAKYIANPSAKKYVSPGSRGKDVVDSKQAELEEIVRKAENEYDLAQKRVDEADEEYWNTKKSEYGSTWMSTL
jgi:hypothetical protein